MGESIITGDDQRLLNTDPILRRAPATSDEPVTAGPRNNGDPYSVGGYDFIDVAIYNEFGDPIGYAKERLGRTETAGGGSGQYVNDALTAASQAISGFLQGQSLADARKLGAAEQFQNLAMWALPAGSAPGGFQRGGPMHQLAARKGRATYQAPPTETRRVDPAALEQPGQVSPEIMQFIDRILSAGGQGRVVATS